MTIALERLRAIKKIITHGREEGPCADGLAAALIVRDMLPDVEVTFARYESAEHRDLVATPGLLFLDISPTPARVREFMEAESLVLDHHASAAPVTRGFMDEGLGAYANVPGVSAATLAYREVWKPLEEALYEDLDMPSFARAARQAQERPVAHFAELAGIYDTWVKESPLWSPACEQTAALYFFPVEEWLREKNLFTRGTLQRRTELGALLVRKNHEQALALVAGAYRFVTSKGTRVAVLSSTENISNATELVDDVDVVVGFGFRVRSGVPSMKLSFRSRGGSVVRPIAEALGGGGHDTAASAWVELHTAYGHPYKTVRTIMEMW